MFNILYKPPWQGFDFRGIEMIFDRLLMLLVSRARSPSQRRSMMLTSVNDLGGVVQAAS
jgi:hypothetical protein